MGSGGCLLTLQAGEHHPKGEVKMENDQIDPVYGYIDNKVKLLKKEIRQLKVAHDAVANAHLQKLLEIQQIVGGWEIHSTVQNLGDIIRNSSLPNSENLITQLIADAVSAKSQALGAREPFKICSQFKEKWHNKVKELGANLIEF